MEKTRIYNSGHVRLKESYYEILKEISEITPHTTFTKKQEEEFLKEAIIIFEYLKSGIDIKSSEILINNGEIPFSCLEKILIKFSEKLWNPDNQTYTFHVYINDEGRPMKIYEFQKNEKRDLSGNSNILLERKVVEMKRKVLFIKSCSSTKVGTLTKIQLKKIIEFALKNDVLVLYDATSSKERKETENVKSIYEIENAKKVAIEFKRFSSVDNDKITCGYLVIPECLRVKKEYCKEDNFFEIKDVLQKEIQKGNVPRKSLKKSFLNYVNL